MTIDTETGSTASASLMAAAAGPRLRRSGRAGHEADGVPALEVPDDLAGKRRLAPSRATQLADDPLLRVLVEVDLLAGERRAPAVHAAGSGSLQGAEAAPQEPSLELLHV
jgi:hypothetical protein